LRVFGTERSDPACANAGDTRRNAKEIAAGIVKLCVVVFIILSTIEGNNLGINQFIQIPNTIAATFWISAKRRFLLQDAWNSVGLFGHDEREVCLERQGVPATGEGTSIETL
jgi:hypothetical protein